MYLRDLADSLLRRWIFVVVVLAMTVGVCFLAARQIPASHQTKASVVLVPPKSVVEPTANRFLELSTLSQAVDVLMRALNADSTQSLVNETAPGGSYETTVDDATSAPVLILTATATSTREADALVDAVLAQVPVRLAALQSELSIAPVAQITALQLTRDEAQVSQRSRLRAVAALAVLCLAGGAVLIGALDSVLLTRSARKALRRRRDGAAGDAMAEEDHVWLEDVLATFSGGVPTAEPATKSTATKSTATKSTKRRHFAKPASRDRE